MHYLFSGIKLLDNIKVISCSTRMVSYLHDRIIIYVVDCSIKSYQNKISALTPLSVTAERERFIPS